jgi:hypothetical protein
MYYVERIGQSKGENADVVFHHASLLAPFQICQALPTDNRSRILSLFFCLFHRTISSIHIMNALARATTTLPRR